MKTVNIKGKEYIMVHERLKFFNEKYTNGSITTERILENEREIIKAIIIPDVDKPIRIFTAYSQATWGDWYINKTSALENAETSAIGRALWFMGIGLDKWVASADEVAKAIWENCDLPF